MKVLFDHGTPAPLRGYIPEHTVDTAAEKGWAELSNGELLDQAESEEYELLITTDQSVRYQQNYDVKYGVDLLQVAAFLRCTHPEGAEALALSDDGPTRRAFLTRT